MATAETFKTYLRNQRIDHVVVLHEHAASSMHSAEAAHVTGEHLAKAVIVKDDDGYLMVVVPSTHHVDLGAVRRHTKRPLGLVTEGELSKLFPDCEPGAVPAVGAAYGIEAAWDSALAEKPEIYLEGGDHKILVRMSGDAFRELMGNSSQAVLSHHI